MQRPAVPSSPILTANPSASPNVVGRRRDAVAAHVASALARLAPGGRLVTITPEGFSPHARSWRETFGQLQAQGRVVFSCGIAGSAYARQGTSVATRLTVIDKMPAGDPYAFREDAGLLCDAGRLLELVEANLPPRLPCNSPPVPDAAACGALFRAIGRGHASVNTGSTRARNAPLPQAAALRPQFENVEELVYETTESAPPVQNASDGLYEPYTVQSIRIEGALPHPTPLVQSAAMASVPPPKPSYRPTLPRAVVTDGLLSDAQLESLIHAGDAHERFFFQPDWKLGKSAPFKRNDRMLATRPIGAVIFPGNGITENLADRARRQGIPVMRGGA